MSDRSWWVVAWFAGALCVAIVGGGIWWSVENPQRFTRVKGECVVEYEKNFWGTVSEMDRACP